MQTFTKNKQEVKYLRQTDGSRKLWLPLVTSNPLKLQLVRSLSLSPFLLPSFFSKFALAQTLESLTVEYLGESVCFSCPFWYQFLTGFRTHLSPQPRKKGWTNDLGCRSQTGKHLQQRKYLLPSLFPKGRTAPCLKGWKKETGRNWIAKTNWKKKDKVQKLLVALSKAAGLNN